ncbi:MAG: hydrogenase iron-sulfur subunit [Negativicutes bacterium]|nr:hydrogenase iron-sulfur subunit [Negativicutes bacterium]
MERGAKLVGFVCKFCALLSFELGPRPDAPVTLELVELPCAGRIDARMLLRAFEQGADAVFVVGCPTHECLNLQGSARAEKRIGRVKALLDDIGLGHERLMLYRVSGTDGPRLAHIVRDAAAKLQEIGLSPLHSPKAGREEKR